MMGQRPLSITSRILEAGEINHVCKKAVKPFVTPQMQARRNPHVYIQKLYAHLSVKA